MRKQFLKLLTRWFVNSLGIWIAAELFTKVELGDGLTPIITAGLLLALVNAILKPLVILLSLPIVLLSLGLFVIVINGLMVLLAGALYGGLVIDGFIASMLAGLVIGLVNYGVTISLEGWGSKKNE